MIATSRFNTFYGCSQNEAPAALYTYVMDIIERVQQSYYFIITIKDVVHFKMFQFYLFLFHEKSQKPRFLDDLITSGQLRVQDLLRSDRSEVVRVTYGHILLAVCVYKCILSLGEGPPT